MKRSATRGNLTAGTKQLLWISMAIVLLFAWTPAQLQNIDNFVFDPSLEDIGCTSGGACIFDATRPSRLFVYVLDTAQLWLYPSNGNEATSYDLSAYHSALGPSTIFDFVAVTDIELLFIGTQIDTGKNELRIYDLNTNQIYNPDTELEGFDLIACDAIPGYPNDNLFVFPNSSQVLLCGTSVGYRNLITFDFATEEIANVIHIPSNPSNPAILPWFKVLVGLDGNIYIDGLQYNAYETLFPSIPRSELEGEELNIVKFEPNSETASALIQVSLDATKIDIARDEILGEGFSGEIIAVDPMGYLYLRNMHEMEGQSVPLVTIFGPTGEFIGQISTNVFLAAGALWFRYQSVDGELIFLNADYSALEGIAPQDFLPNSYPVATAGSDQTVTDANNNGSESVTLNGAGSSDSDGTVALYSWKENETEIGTGVNPQVSLSLGTHTITLTVTDNDGATDTDEVVVKVNAPPVANAGPDQTAHDTNSNGSE